VQATLDLSQDAVTLTQCLVDVASVSGDEDRLAGAVHRALDALAGITVERSGNTVLARTDGDRPERIILAGHLDTVPLADNLPSRRVEDRLYGCGTSDMKSGLAVALRLAHLVGAGQLDPRFELTWIFYDCEEVDAARNGLRRLADERPQDLRGDLAILLEPTSGLVEAGCQGTLRAVVRTAGRRAHTARAWLGSNAIHAAADVLNRLSAYEPRQVSIDGLTYREGLNAVAISGGVAGNVVPDECRVTVNLRFAPDRDEAAARAHLEAVFAGYAVDIVDSAPSARPGLDSPLAQELVRATGAAPLAKLAWTDVARFAALGVPALNLGPGDPNQAHQRDEYVDVAAITAVERSLMNFITG
jgi:succinyl-diaminopimelate desuccinylase